MSNDDSTSVLRKGPGVPWCGSGPIEKAATEKVAAAAVEAAEQAAAMQAEQAASIAEGSHRHTCDRHVRTEKLFLFFGYKDRLPHHSRCLLAMRRLPSCRLLRYFGEFPCFWNASSRIMDSKMAEEEEMRAAVKSLLARFDSSLREQCPGWDPEDTCERFLTAQKGDRETAGAMLEVSRHRTFRRRVLRRVQCPNSP